MILLYPEILKWRAHTHPHRTALIFETKTITYQQLYEHALECAAWLQNEGLQKGDCIAFLDLNNDTYVHFVNGCFLMGIIPLSVNWRLKPSEIEFIINDAECKAIIYGNTFKAVIDEATKNAEIATYCMDGLDLQILRNPVISHPILTDLALLIYTSGTTGYPKGVMLTHQNLFAMYNELRHETPLFGPASVNLIAGPWYAIIGFGYFMFGIFAGATNVLLRIFDPINVCRIIEQHRVTNAFLAPVMMRAICSLDDVNEYNLSSLQNIQYGGSPISEDQLKICFNTFKCHFTQGYGLTETSGIGTALRFDDHEKILSAEYSPALIHSAGKPYSSVQIKIMMNQSTEAKTHEVGEVWLKGTIVSNGYWNRPKENKIAFDGNKWFHSGDMGYLNDDGYLFLVDRKDDMIISKGTNIYPAEIEKVLMRHPQIKEIAVIGIPHETFGEAVCAVAVIRNGELTLPELRKWAINELSDYKLPSHLEILQELPRNPTGKILRRELREPYWKNKQRQIQR